MQNSETFCIWLTFDSALLESIIFDLSKRYGGPVFQPHCTLIGKTDIPLLQLKSSIINVYEHFKPKRVHIDKISYSDKYWKSFYIEFSEKEDVVNLHLYLNNILGLNDQSNFQPHISLMYNSLNIDVKSKIKIPLKKGDAINIRSIQITECNEEIEYWKPVFELSLIN